MQRQSDLNNIYGVQSQREQCSGAGANENGIRHSSAYHNFFRGYTEIRRETATGRIRIERYYTQPWIVSTEPAKKYWLRRILYLLLIISGWLLYIGSMCMDIESNRSLLVAVFGFAAVLMLVLLSATCLSYLFAHKKMTLWDQTSTSGQLKTRSAAAGSFMLLTAAARMYAVISLRQGTAQEGIGIIALLLSATCILSIQPLEKQVNYAEIPNKTTLPDGERHEIW